ncbi:MAG: universal stress protein [Candidatus Accumulibacter phosphatis]|jgi:nucleotide-binding universal stress UspA family protein|uniref:universal stress protein n=1 Tax=Candidatus Accumulibacter sp. ACC012 TaxID=2823332 RepID=UPI0025C6F673|nr:universal stress protein [Candidatus Accumulibacter sp. ACC012]
MFQHILVPTDGSHLSQKTAERAVAFAKAANAKITALYAKAPVGHAENYGDLIQPAAIQRLISGSDGKSKEYLGAIKKLCKEAGVESTTLAVVSDTPWEAIVKVAEDNNCDLIFMAKHSRGGLSSLLVGSQTYRVLTHSNIPVLVFRAPKAHASHHKHHKETERVGEADSEKGSKKA